MAIVDGQSQNPVVVVLRSSPFSLWRLFQAQMNSLHKVTVAKWFLVFYFLELGCPDFTSNSKTLEIRL
jgi:hypothetical protein